MSKISKYLQVNERLLMEYSYDTKAKAKAKNRDVAILKDRSSRLMYFENPLQKTIYDDFKKGLMFTAFPDTKMEDAFFYAGHISNPNTEDAWIANPAEKLVSSGKVLEMIGSSSTIDIPYETVRIWIMTGYTFNDVEGFILRIKAKQSSKCIMPCEEREVVLGSFVFHKSLASSVVKFSKKPFYQHSRFYDRYIEFQIPSAYYMAARKKLEINDENDITLFDILGIENGRNIRFEFSTIEGDRFQAIQFEDTKYLDFFRDAELSYSDRILYNQGDFNVSKFLNANIVLNSEADNFNLRLFEDKERNCIRYYPVWGDVVDDNPITRKIMNSIENGSIRISLNSFLDVNDTALDEFEAIYGEEARHWIVVNQIELDYHYQPILSSNLAMDREIVITRKFNYTEDFEDDNDNYTSIGDIYKFVYRPVVESLNNGYVCRYINVTYTGRLVNRLNGEEIVRIATLDINDAESKFGQFSQMIDTRNLYTWKLFNKIESEKIQVSKEDSQGGKAKYITKFVNNLDFAMVDEDGVSNIQGKFVIKLYDTEHIYKMRLFEDASMTKAYSLGEANASYLLRVTCGADNTPVYIRPTFSENMNSVMGELEFKISEENAKRIMQGDKKWHIVAQTETGITTLFAGKFESVFSDED